MRPIFRISTSPPNDWDGAADEAAYYCDLHEIDGWREFPLLRELSPAVREMILRDGVVGYVVVGAYDGKEIGLLILVRDDIEGIAYRGIDHRGRVSSEPAANEALWTMANAAQGLADSHRLARGGTH